MTQFSFPWECFPVGDGGANSYSLDGVVEPTNRYLHNLNPDDEGIVYWTQAPYNGLFAATNPAGNTVRIASGVGMVEGWIMESDANVDFDVTGGAANAIDQIVMRTSRAGLTDQTVRLALLRGPAGTFTAPTQTATTWEVPLWRVNLDAGGNFSSLVDVRKVITSPLGPMVKLDEIVSDGTLLTADFTNIPDVFRHLKIVADIQTQYAVANTDQIDLTVNGVVAASYDYHSDVFSLPASTYTATFTNNSNQIPFFVVTNASLFSITSPVEIIIPNYKNTGYYKTAVINTDVHADNTTKWWREVVTGHLKQVTPISRLTLTPNSGSAFSQNSVFTLYGLT